MIGHQTQQGEAMTSKRNHVQTAVDALGATKIACGRHGKRKWAYWADETQTYWVVDHDDMVLYGRMLTDYRHGRPHGSSDAAPPEHPYSDWCAASCAQEMPRNWRP
jgi:hypothetical protein